MMNIRRSVETAIYWSTPVLFVILFAVIFFPNVIAMVGVLIVSTLELVIVETTQYYLGWFEETKTFFGKKKFIEGGK